MLVLRLSRAAVVGGCNGVVEIGKGSVRRGESNM